jgi:hypothetical protein
VRPEGVAARASTYVYRRFATRMGELCLYTERFGDPLDVDEWRDEYGLDELEEAEDALGGLVDLTIGWLEAEAGSAPRFGELRQVLDEDLRADLQQLLCHGWLMDAMDPYVTEEGAVTALVEAGHRAIERGFVRTADLPRLYRLVGEDDVDGLLRLARERLAERAGYSPEDIDGGALAFLADVDSAAASLRAYLRTTDAYRERLRQWRDEWDVAEGEGEGSPEDEPFDPLEIPEELMEEVVEPFFSFDLFGGGGGSLSVRLACPVQSLETNGQWDAETGRIAWPRGSARRFCYAFWSVADAEFQAARFGRVILDGDGLSEYVLWRCSLTEAQAEQWDRFLCGLEPASARAQLERFELAGSPGLADTPRRLLFEPQQGGSFEVPPDTAVAPGPAAGGSEASG